MGFVPISFITICGKVLERIFDVSTNPELKYGVLRHQQLFRRQGVSQRLNKGQYFNLKPDGRTSSERTESPLNVLPKIKRQSLNIRSARPDKVRISLKMRRFF